MRNVKHGSRQQCHANGSRKKSKCTAIEPIWNTEIMITPVLIGATGVLTKCLKKHLESMLGKHSIQFLKHTTMLQTSHALR